MQYNATTTHFFGVPPYLFLTAVGLVCAASLFILLLLRYGRDIPRYTRIFILSVIGLLLGAKLFDCFSDLCTALASGVPLDSGIVFSWGITFYGGMLGFLAVFLLLCKKFDHGIDYEIVDLAVVSIPLFHFWGRLACFFGGCCYGLETHSFFSVVYTTWVNGRVSTASRLPVQLIESGVNAALFTVLLHLLLARKLKGRLIFVYLCAYAVARFILEFFRADAHRGVWGGVSFSQIVSLLVLATCAALLSLEKFRKNKYVAES